MRARTTFGLLSLACSCAAHADVIADVLRVHYEGTITKVFEDNVGYNAGDTIAGTLIVDLHRAPPDREPGDPAIGEYRNGGDSRFVTGFAPNGAITFDEVVVRDNRGSPENDSFAITDNEERFGPTDPSGGMLQRVDAITMLTVGPPITLPGGAPDRHEFATNDGLIQDFELKGESVGSGEVSRSKQLLDNFQRPVRTFFAGAAQFVLQVLTVTPGQCKP